MPSREIARCLCGRGWNPSPTDSNRPWRKTVGADIIRPMLSLCDHLIRHGFAVPPSPQGEGLFGRRVVVGADIIRPKARPAPSEIGRGGSTRKDQSLFSF